MRRRWGIDIAIEDQERVVESAREMWASEAARLLSEEGIFDARYMRMKKRAVEGLAKSLQKEEKKLLALKKRREVGR